MWRTDPEGWKIREWGLRVIHGSYPAMTFDLLSGQPVTKAVEEQGLVPYSSGSRSRPLEITDPRPSPRHYPAYKP